MFSTKKQPLKTSRTVGTGKRPATRASICSCGLAMLLAAALAAPANAYQEDKNWPCIQAKVAKLSAGQMWPGLTLNPEQRNWQEDEAVKRLIEKLLPRRVSLEETEKIIAEFASNYKGDNLNLELEKTFLGLLDETNRIRAEIITGIGRFSGRQKDLVNRITDNRHKLSTYEKKDEDGTLTRDEDKEMVKLEQALEWDQRIHEEREQSLEFVCESPVLLEQRLFALAKQLKAKDTSVSN